jgi:hypothetical protein
MAGFALTAIMSAAVLPNHFNSVFDVSPVGFILYHVGIFGISLIAGLFLASISKSLLGFLASYTLGIILTWLALAFPGLTGTISAAPAQDLATVFTLTAFFPFALLIGLAASILGAVFTEP